MLTRNIDFKNFRIKKNTQIVKKKLKKLIQENNEVIKSLRKSYKNSYDRRLVNKYNKGSNYTVIGMGGSTLGTQTIYDFLGKKIDQGEEFLVIKKNPLVVPPDFEKMPIPKNEIEKSNTVRVENNQDSDFKKLLKTQDQNVDVSESEENSGNLEKKIIDKIK